MTARGLLRIALLLALVPLVIKGTRSRFDSDDDMDDADRSMDPDADIEEPDGLVDINSASEEVLATLPGIGALNAADIVANRPYRAKLDLVRRGIVSEATYQTIRDQVIARHRSIADAESQTSQGHA